MKIKDYIEISEQIYHSWGKILYCMLYKSINRNYIETVFVTCNYYKLKQKCNFICYQQTFIWYTLNLFRNLIDFSLTFDRNK